MHYIEQYGHQMQTLDQTGTIDKAVNFNLFVLFTSQVADHIQVVRQLGC